MEQHEEASPREEHEIEEDLNWFNSIRSKLEQSNKDIKNKISQSNKKIVCSSNNVIIYNTLT